MSAHLLAPLGVASSLPSLPGAASALGASATPAILVALAIGLAGAGGAVGRLTIDALVKHLILRVRSARAKPSRPAGNETINSLGRETRPVVAGTLSVNLSGCLAAGVFAALAARSVTSPEITQIIATGFLGGYTTFSTAVMDVIWLARAEPSRGSAVVKGVFLAGFTLVAGGALAGLGWHIAS